MREAIIKNLRNQKGVLAYLFNAKNPHTVVGRIQCCVDCRSTAVLVFAEKPTSGLGQVVEGRPCYRFPRLDGIFGSVLQVPHLTSDLCTRTAGVTAVTVRSAIPAPGIVRQYSAVLPSVSTLYFAFKSISVPSMFHSSGSSECGSSQPPAFRSMPPSLPGRGVPLESVAPGPATGSAWLAPQPMVASPRAKNPTRPHEAAVEDGYLARPAQASCWPASRSAATSSCRSYQLSLARSPCRDVQRPPLEHNFRYPRITAVESIW
jgi:hypothetical protein